MSKVNGFVSFNCMPVRTGLSSICPLIDIWVSLRLAVTEFGELEHKGN